MICPHCGNRIPNLETCTICGMPTEFARRANFQSTGHGEIQTSEIKPIKTVQSIEPRVNPKKGIIVLLCLTVFLAILVLSLSCTTVLLANEMASMRENEAQSTFPAGTSIPETVAESTEMAVKNTTEAVPFEPTKTVEINETVDFEAQKPRIIFDLNPSAEMQTYMANQIAPQSINFSEAIPPFHDISDWIFTGWNTKPDGTGVKLEVGQMVDSIPLSDNLILYAQWDELWETEPVG